MSATANLRRAPGEGEASASVDVDVAHVVTALRRVRDPMMRYLITQLVDLLTQQVQALEQRAERTNGSGGRAGKR